MSAVLFFMLAYLLLFIIHYLFIKFFSFKMLPEKILNGKQEKEIISSALLNKEEIF